MFPCLKFRRNILKVFWCDMNTLYSENSLYQHSLLQQNSLQHQLYLHKHNNLDRIWVHYNRNSVFGDIHWCCKEGRIFYVFVLSCVCYVFVRVCLYVLCGHLLGKGWPLGSRLWCLMWVCHFPIGILGQVWYLIVSIPDLCTLTYFDFIL